MRKRQILEKYSVIINIILKASKILPKWFYKSLIRLIRNWDSIVAVFIRYICLKNLCKSCGNNVAVFPGVFLLNIENLEIGDNVSIHPMCYIDASGGISIGNDVSIAHSTTIMSTEHKYTDLSLNIKDQGCIHYKTTIHDNVWIGAGCRILAGANIGSGSIVAAGAVVKGKIEENIIVGGVPAKKIKGR